MTSKKTLVLGGTGKTGRRVAQRLIGRGIPVRIGSRFGSPRFDWTNYASWPAVLEHVDSVYVTYHPDLAAPGALEAVQSFTEIALAAGVRRLVLLSGRGEAASQECEEIVRAACGAATVLRCSWFAQNFSENHFVEPLLAGELALPVGNVGEPFVDADDIADVAVAALTEEGHEGQTYELTGPRLWTFAQAAAEIARGTGRPIRYVQVPADEYRATLAKSGVSTDLAALCIYLFTELFDGRNARVANGVQRALGRSPRDFAEYVRDAAAAGAWKSVA